MGDAAMAGGGAGGCCRFMGQLLRGRWFMMAASFLIMTGAGATYLFGVYSKEIKATLGYDQTTLNLLGSIKDLGASVGVLSGLLAEVTPTWFVLLVGSAMNFAGYFLIWLSVTRKISKPAVWQMCVFICVGANSQNFANTGALVTCVKNFPESRGMMLGLLKGFVGLSGAVFTQLYYAIYGNDAKSMILLIGWLPAVISVVFVYTIRAMKASTHPNELNVLYQYLYISIALALCLMGLTIAQKQVQFTHFGYVGSSIGVCLLILLPFLIAIREELATWKRKNQPVAAAPSEVVIAKHPQTLPESCRSRMQNEAASRKHEDEDEVPCCSCTDICNKPKRGEDYSILQALLSADMIILFIANFCGQGSSLAAVDNLGQIGESLGYRTHTIGTFVSLVSIWNYFGRVFVGFTSETLVVKRKIPRTLFMTISLLISCVGYLFIAFPFPGSVYVASLLIGFSYGGQLTLLFTIISELFGLKYYSTLFNCGQIASPLGSYILNVQIVGRLYDREAMGQLALKGMTRSMVKELTCLGRQCYRRSFIVLAVANLVGALVSLILVFRTRKFYGGDIYEKFRKEMENNQMEMARVSGTTTDQQQQEDDRNSGLKWEGVESRPK